MADPIPFNPLSLTLSERELLFGNVFHNKVIPDSSAIFFAEEPEVPREEIKGADVTVRGSDKPWQIVYGECRVGGVITFVTTDIPGGGEWIHLVNTVAGHEIYSVTDVLFDGESVPFGTSGDHLHGWATGDWAFDPPAATSYVFTSVSDGDPDQVANADLVYQSGELFPGIWTSNHRQRGRAHIYHILYFHPDKFPEGLPEIQYLIKGKTGIYDPRSGGSYGYTNNACLCIADYLSNSEIGLGAAYGTEIDTDNLEAAADIADENVTLADGSTEKRYTMNGVFDVSETPDQILRKMQTTIGGPIVFQNGKWKMYPATWRAPSLTLTEDDVVSTINVTTNISRRQSFNAVKGTYLSPDDGWEISDFPAVTNAVYETEDGEQSFKDITLPLTTSPATAQRLAKIMLERVRQSIYVEMICTLKAFQLQVSDVVYLTNSRLGWAAKEFEVLILQPVFRSNALAIRLVLKETAEAIYDWNSGEETTIDLAPNTTLPAPTAVTDPANLVLESGTDQLFLRQDGTVFSRIKVSWDAVTNPFIKNGGRVEIRAKNDTEGESYRIVGSVPGDQTFTYVLDVKDGDTYSVGVRNINTIGVKTDWVTAQHTIIGKTTPPNVVENFSGNQVQGGVDFAWSEISDKDISHYTLIKGDDRENALTYSEDYTNADWTKTRSTIDAAEITAPNLALTGSKLVEDATASNTHEVVQDGLSVVLGQTYRAKIYAKASERTKLRVTTHINGFPTEEGAVFDLSAGSVDSIVGTATNVQIKKVTQDFYECSFEATSDETHADAKLQIQLCDANGDYNYTGDGSSGLYIWGASFQDQTANGIYIKTEASAATAGTIETIARPFATEFTWNPQIAASYTLNIYAVDTTGNKSVEYTTLNFTVQDSSTPQNLTANISGPDINLSWDAPATSFFQIVEYQIKQDDVLIDTIKGSSHKQRADFVGSVTFKVLAVDVAGNVGDAASLEVTIIAPGAVQNISPIIIHNNVLLDFEAPSSGTLPVEYYVVKKGATLLSAIEVSQSSRSFVPLLETAGGEYTYWIIPVDSAGNEGTALATVLQVGKPPNYSLEDERSIDADEGDTITNLYIYN